MSEPSAAIELPRADAETIPELSIVVLITHDAEQAARCLRSIARFGSEPGGAETILVLNDSSEEVRELVAERCAGARLIDCDFNTGTMVGWNIAFAAARAPRVLLLHEDAELTEGVARDLFAALDEHPRAAVVGPWFTREPGAPVAQAGWLSWSDGESIMLRPRDLNDDQRAKPYAVDTVSSAVSMWDRAAWLSAGGFEERLFPAVGLEPDICNAFWTRGRQVLCVPTAVALHCTGAMDSGRGPLSGDQLRWFLHERNVLGFLRDKWSGVNAQRLDRGERGWSEPWSREAIAALLADVAARSSAMPKPAPPQLHPITDPEETGAPPTALTPEIRERLKQAERDTVDEYLSWLIIREAKTRAELAAVAAARDDLEQRSAALQAIYEGGWWRLRGRLRRLVGKRD